MYNAVGSESYISSRGPEFDHTFVEIDHELFSVVILLLPPIQEGGVASYVQESIVDRLYSLSLPVSLTDRPDICP